MPTVPEIFTTAFGSYPLQRYPRPTGSADKQQPLRAWDAADEYLLQWLHQQGLPRTAAATLIVNDSFGALTVSLSHTPLWSQSDSVLAQLGCRANLAANAIPADDIQLLDSLQAPTAAIELALVKIPKSLALLEDQLYRLRPLLSPGAKVVGAGMTKTIHNSTLQLFARVLGPTHTSLAQKKARLIFCQPAPQDWRGDSPYPSYYPLENTELTLCNHAAVFSRAGLDIGSRFLLQNLPDLGATREIIDLGCGNGVLGLMAKRQWPGLHCHFYDESHMAIASARHNIEAAFGSTAGCEFSVNDCLRGVPANSADAILNNPPFHQQQVVGDHIAWQMFRDSHRVLRRGGLLCVVGNRHLGYHSKLQRLFGNCEVSASNRKFVILQARK